VVFYEEREIRHVWTRNYHSYFGIGVDINEEVFVEVDGAYMVEPTIVKVDLPLVGRAIVIGQAGSPVFEKTGGKKWKLNE